MTSKKWLQDYFQRYEQSLLKTDVSSQLIELRDLVMSLRASGKHIFFAGNGASASIASHAAVDFTKQAKVPAFDFNEPNFITAFSNDFGYENWIAKALEYRASAGDVVVLISSSGKSANIVNGARRAKELGLTIVGFSGFAEDNPLRSLSDIDFWVDSRGYNIVECTHMVWLMAAVDFVIGEVEYPVD
jgi:D-sedoheptulose 7-phosphate isomerase